MDQGNIIVDGIRSSIQEKLAKFKDYSKHKTTLVITGPPRSGKSTFVNYIKKEQLTAVTIEERTFGIRGNDGDVSELIEADARRDFEKLAKLLVKRVSSRSSAEGSDAFEFWLTEEDLHTGLSPFEWITEDGRIIHYHLPALLVKGKDYYGKQRELYHEFLKASALQEPLLTSALDSPNYLVKQLVNQLFRDFSMLVVSLARTSLGGIPGSVVAYLILRISSAGEREPQNRLMNLAVIWRNLDDEVKSLVATRLALEMGMGTEEGVKRVLGALNSVLVKESEKLKDVLERSRTWTELMASDLQELARLVNLEIENRLARWAIEVKDEAGAGSLLKVSHGQIPLMTSGEVGKKLEEISVVIENGVCLLTGRKGAGKTTLLYLLALKLMAEGKRVFVIRNVSVFNPVEFLRIKNAYAILDVRDSDEARELKTMLKRVKGLDQLKRMVISIGVDQLEELEGLIGGFHRLEVRYGDHTLREMAKSNLKAMIPQLDGEKIERLSSTLVEGSEGLPLYLAEATKLIRESGDVEVSPSNFPKGLRALVAEILKNETERLGGQGALLYHLVSRYPGIPQDYAMEIGNLLGIKEEMKYVERGTNSLNFPIGLHVHGVYGDLIEEALKARRKFVEGEGGDSLTRVRDSLRTFLGTLADLPLIRGDFSEIYNFVERSNLPATLKQALENFKREKFDMKRRFGLEEATDLMLLLSLVRLVGNRIQGKSGNRFNVLEESVDYVKLKAENIVLFHGVLSFLIHTYTREIAHLSPGSRPLYYFIVLLISRLIRSKFGDSVAQQFLGRDPGINLTAREMYALYKNSQDPLTRVYGITLFEALRKLNYFESDLDDVFLMISVMRGDDDEALRSIDRLVKAEPNYAPLHYMRGDILGGLGRYEEAVREFDEAIKLDPQNQEYRVVKAETLSRAGRLEEAVREFDEAIKLDPHNSVYRNNKGGILVKLGRYEEAVREFDEAIKLDPREPTYHMNKGVALGRLGRYEEAVREFDEAIKLDPREPTYHNFKAQALAKVGRLEEAIREIDKAIELDPNNPNHHVDKGKILTTGKLYQEALKEYETAISLDPYEPEYHNLKGVALLRVGRLEEAIRKIDKAIELDPHNPLYHKNRGEILEGIQRYQEALKEYETAISLDPRNPEYHSVRGTLLRHLGNLKDALEEHELAIDLDPENPVYHANKAEDLFRVKLYQEALKEYETAISLDPYEPEYHNLKGVALSYMGRLEEAIREIDKAIELDPNNPIYHANRANMLAERGRREEALREFDRAISLDPKNPEYHESKGDILEELGNYREALKEYEAAVNLDPKNPEYHMEKGYMLEVLGNLREALKEYETAISLDPNNPIYHEYRGIALEELGNLREALKEYETAISLDPNNPEYHGFKGRALVELGKPKEALTELNKAINLNPNNPVFRAYKAIALLSIGECHEAIKEIKNAIKLDPNNAKLAYYQKLIREHCGPSARGLLV